MSEDYVLAADLGGTNLRTAAVSREGSILFQRRTATPQKGAAADIIKAITDEAAACISHLGHRPSAFGVAAAALIDAAGTRVLSSPNLPQLNDVMLSGDISDRLGLAVALENDATAAAIGEHWMGASKGVDTSICVTLGTGVGGGLIIDGRPFRGATGTAGEVGHLCVEPDGLNCGCGSHGCLEQYASATAIVRIAKEERARTPGSKLDPLLEFTADDVYCAGREGDEASLESFRIMGRYLGIGLAGLINVFNPQMIVIGGGASAGWDLFIDHVREEVLARAFEHPAKAVKIVRSELGNLAGTLGAAEAAFELADHRGAVGQSLS